MSVRKRCTLSFVSGACTEPGNAALSPRWGGHRERSADVESVAVTRSAAVSAAAAIRAATLWAAALPARPAAVRPAWPRPVPGAASVSRAALPRTTLSRSALRAAARTAALPWPRLRLWPAAAAAQETAPGPTRHYRRGRRHHRDHSHCCHRVGREGQPYGNNRAGRDADVIGIEGSEARRRGKVGSTITLAGNDSGERVAVTVTKIYRHAQPASSFDDPDTGDRLVAVQFRLTDTGSAAYSDSPSNGAEVVDASGQSYQSALNDAANCPSFPGTENIAPGASGLGCIVFEVPQAAVITKVQFTLDSGMGPQTGQWNVSRRTRSPGGSATPAPTASRTPAPTASRTPAPSTSRTAAPSPTPQTTAPAAAPATSSGCYPRTDAGNCYEPGEYCRDSDHGMSGVTGDGESIVCEDNDGWRWEPA